MLFRIYLILSPIVCLGKQQFGPFKNAKENWTSNAYPYYSGPDTLQETAKYKHTSAWHFKLYLILFSTQIFSLKKQTFHILVPAFFLLLAPEWHALDQNFRFLLSISLIVVFLQLNQR